MQFYVPKASSEKQARYLANQYEEMAAYFMQQAEKFASRKLECADRKEAQKNMIRDINAALIRDPDATTCHPPYRATNFSHLAYQYHFDRIKRARAKDKMKRRNERIRQLAERRLSYTRIGELYNLSRWRVAQIVKEAASI